MAAARRRSLARTVLVLLAVLRQGASDDNESSNSTRLNRTPRVSGRIVKLYSSPRSEGFHCVTEGFHADPTNCAAFYRCLESSNGRFTIFKFQCGPHTIFDPETGICNFPRSTRRAECGGDVRLPSASAFRSFSASTLSSIENEIDSNEADQPPPSPILNSPTANDGSKLQHKPIQTQQRPVIDIKPIVQTRPVTSEVIPKETTASTTWSTLFSFRSHSNLKNNDAFNHDDQAEQCLSDGFMGDSRNCRKFYRCVANGRGGFIKYEFSCSETTVWDDNLQACNHNWAARNQRCGRRETSDTEANLTEKSKLSFGDKKSDENYNDKLSSTKFVQTTQNIIGIKHNIVNKNDFNAQIINEIKSSVTTQKPKHTKLVTKSKAPTIFVRGSYGSEDSETDEEATTESSQNSDSSNQCQSSGFMGDSNDCKKFYRCVDNGKGSYTRYEFKCGEGTLWDQTNEACNHAWAVKKCGGNSEDINKEDEQTTQAHTTTQATSSTTSTNEKHEDSDQGYNRPTSTTSEESSTTSSEKSTTQKNKPSNSNQCTSSGFMGDSSDCKKFYRCVDNGKGGYDKYEFSCGEGTVWDSNIDGCNHAWAVKNCGQNSSQANKEEEPTTKHDDTTTTTSKTSTTDNQLDDDDSGYAQSSDDDESSTTQKTTSTTNNNENSNGSNDCTSSGFMGDKNDCKKFYRCVDNGRGGFIKYEFSCGEGTLWDQSNEACNHEWAVSECGGTPSENDKTQSTTKTYETTTKPSETTKAEESTMTSTENNAAESSSDECTKEGYMGDRKDCTKFYRCVDDGRGGYTKYAFTCGEGTAWDSEINACNHKNAVKRPCGEDHSQGDSNTSTSTSNQQPENDEEVDITSSSTESTSQEMTESIKSPQGDDNCQNEGFYADSKDCKKFYRCVDNGRGGYTKHDFTCGDGTVWDQEIQACNHPTSDGQCKSQQNQPQSEQTTQSNQQSSTDTQESSTNSQKETSSTKKPSESDGKCNSEGFHADENDCKKFYRCVDNGKGGYTKYDFVCGEGTVWDQEIQGCNFETNGKECSQKSSEGTSEKTEENHTTESQQQTSQQMQDEYDNSEEDGEQTTKKSSDEGSGGKCTSEGFHANENNCKKFYRCVDNGKGGYTRYDFDCGEGTAWDQDAQTCNHEDSVNCKSSNQGSNNQSENNEGDNDESTTKKSETSSESNDQNSSSDDKQCSSGKCTEEGYFGNPNDCKKFYRCVDNGKGGFTKYDFDCGEGTIWDQDVTTCNHPGDVKNPSCKGENSESNCESSSSSSSSEDSSSSSEDSGSSSTTESSSSQSQESSSSSDSDSTTSKPSSSNISCPEAGFYANPDDCKKFYRCVDFEGDGKSYTVFHFDCGEGTVWDPNLDTCNYEDSIYPPRDCSKQSQSQEVDNGDESESTTEDSSAQESTTEESTTQKQTTKEQQESSSEESTTQQSSTTEESSTKESTSESQTTQESTTKKSTTESQKEESTTKESTTKESTTEEQTTKQSTTEESTTEEQTTKESTTEESTTEESTTEESTTEESTTEESTTEESTTEESTTEESTTESSSEESTSESDSTTQSQEDSTQEQTDGTTEESTTESSSEDSESNSTTESSSEDSSESSTEESGTTESSSSKDCPETDDDQFLLVCPTGFRRHPKYCNLFYQCSEDEDNHDIKVAVFHCDDNTIYDDDKNQCVEEKDTDQKCEGEMAERRRFKRLDLNSKSPIPVHDSRLKCPSEGHFPFDKNDTCSAAFLKCNKSRSSQKLRAFVYRCPESFTYWSVSRRCEHSSKMRECKKHDSKWKGRWEIPIEKFNVAPIRR